jgi:hypothetical protein
MATERMADGEARMIEVFGWRVNHPEALHHAARALIGRDGERNNFVKAQYVKGEIDDRFRRFGGIASSPMLECDPPAYFNARREMSFKRRHIETDETDKAGDSHYFHGPATEAVAIEVLPDTRNPSIAFLAG